MPLRPGDFNPFDPLHITVGGRYTKDDKNGLLYTVNGAATNFTFDQSNNRFDPLVVLAYEVNRDINVYAKYATGYRAGGASSRSLNYRSFGPEGQGVRSRPQVRILRPQGALQRCRLHHGPHNTQVDFNYFILQRTAPCGTRWKPSTRLAPPRSAAWKPT
jgi:iron complex outermembrane receptor protein